MASDIFKVNRELIDKAEDLYFYGNDVIKHGSPYSNLIRYGRFRVPKVIFGELCGNELGHYDPSQHLIALDLSLVPDSMEDVRQNVFLHELAHAVDTVLNGGSNHDSEFKKICRNLGVDERFVKAKTSVADKEKAKKKIDKLLALSASDFENEASAALAKAKELMLSNGLEYLYSDEEDQLYGCILENRKSLHTYEKNLAGFICRITGAFYFTESTNDRRLIKVFGSLEQVETTMYVYNDLITKVNHQCSVMSRQWKQSNPWSSFSSVQTKDGLVRGIMSKNRNIENSIKGTALEVSSIAIQRVYEKLYHMKFRMLTSKTKMSSQTILAMGVGKNIDVSFNKGGITKRIGYAG